MAYSAKVILDSVADNGCRLTTMEVSYPRIIHAELMTHRVMSRNAASSRAIPVKKLLQRIIDDPFVPEEFGSNKPGMQAGEILTGEAHKAARAVWLKARDDAHAAASTLALDLNAHKQLANRIVEPFSWLTVIITATDWQNFFRLRCHPHAQPEFKKIADMMLAVYSASNPSHLALGAWHTPYIHAEHDVELSEIGRIQASVARCARVSYLTHDGKHDINKDLNLFNRLLNDRHMSPFEHVATPSPTVESDGNFRGFKQYRKMLADECAVEPVWDSTQ